MIAGIVAQGARGDAAPDGAHSYWRVLALAVNGGAAIGLAKLDFLDSDGASLVAGGTAFSSSVWDGGHAPANAFDGSSSTVWASANGMALPQYIGYQFPTPVSVSSYAITARGSPGNLQAPATFKLQFSDDGIEWHDSDERVSQTQWGVGEIRSYVVAKLAPAGTFHLWRILVSATDGYASAMISEMEMRSDAGGGNIAICPPNSRAISSPPMETGYPAHKAFDGVVGTGWFDTWWSQNVGVDGVWLGFHFDEPVSINQIKIWPRQGYLTMSPRNFKIQATNNPISGEWTDIWSVSGQTGWQWMVPRTFTKP